MINFENLKENNSGHWTYKGSDQFEVPLGAFGFVYKIECVLPQDELDRLGITKTKYLGRKYLSAAKTTSRRVSLKSGAKVTKKKKSRVESDWQTYTGSCLPLNDQIEKLGKENFRFEILEFFQTKGQCNMAEAIIQIQFNVMIDNSYFNEAIGSGLFRGVKLDDNFKNLLKEIKYRNTL